MIDAVGYISNYEINGFIGSLENMGYHVKLLKLLLNCRGIEMEEKELYKMIAGSVEARLNCLHTNNIDWAEKHTAHLENFERELPRGSGFDSGTTIDLIASKPDKIILRTAFHYMNDAGYYNGWQDYKVIIKPSLTSDFNLRIIGKDRNMMKDYMYDVFDSCLRKVI